VSILLGDLTDQQRFGGFYNIDAAVHPIPIHSIHSILPTKKHVRVGFSCFCDVFLTTA